MSTLQSFQRYLAEDDLDGWRAQYSTINPMKRDQSIQENMLKEAIKENKLEFVQFFLEQGFVSVNNEITLLSLCLFAHFHSFLSSSFFRNFLTI